MPTIDSSKAPLVLSIPSMLALIGVYTSASECPARNKMHCYQFGVEANVEGSLKLGFDCEYSKLCDLKKILVSLFTETWWVLLDSYRKHKARVLVVRTYCEQ